MATNQILPFGIAAGANVLSPSEYQSLATRAGGFQSGVAKSKELNTVWRQASFVAAMLGQYIADKSGQDVLDNGDLAALQAKFVAALAASPAFTGTPTAPTPAPNDNSTRLATTAFVAGNFPRVYSINSLPAQNVGPITVAECGEVWIWSSSAYFTGYRSPLCGRPVDGHTNSPLVSEIDAIGGDLNKAAYPGLWGYAQENGLVVSDSAWIANRGAHLFVDTGASTFRVPDLRNIFRRYTGTNADTGGARAFGSLMHEATKEHLHNPSGASQFAMLFSGGGSGFTGSGYTVNGVSQTGGMQGGGGAETRPINTAYYPRIHI